MEAFSQAMLAPNLIMFGVSLFGIGAILLLMFFSWLYYR